MTLSVKPFMERAFNHAAHNQLNGEHASVKPLLAARINPCAERRTTVSVERRSVTLQRRNDGSCVNGETAHVAPSKLACHRRGPTENRLAVERLGAAESSEEELLGGEAACWRR